MKAAVSSFAGVVHKPADFGKCFRGKSTFRIIWRYIAGLFLIRIGGISCKNLASYDIELSWRINKKMDIALRATRIYNPHVITDIDEFAGFDCELKHINLLVYATICYKMLHPKTYRWR